MVPKSLSCRGLSVAWTNLGLVKWLCICTFRSGAYAKLRWIQDCWRSWKNERGNSAIWRVCWFLVTALYLGHRKKGHLEESGGHGVQFWICGLRGSDKATGEDETYCILRGCSWEGGEGKSYLAVTPEHSRTRTDAWKLKREARGLGVGGREIL